MRSFFSFQMARQTPQFLWRALAFDLAGQEAMKWPVSLQYRHRLPLNRRCLSSGVSLVCPICMGSTSAPSEWETWTGTERVWFLTFGLETGSVDPEKTEALFNAGVDTEKFRVLCLVLFLVRSLLSNLIVKRIKSSKLVGSSIVLVDPWCFHLRP